MAGFFHFAKSHEQFFTDHGQRLVYKKQQCLVRPEDADPWVYYLDEGLVKASFSFVSGDERLIGFFVPGSTFAQSGSFYQDEGGGLEYLSVTPVVAYRVARQVFLDRLQSDVSFSADYTQMLLKNQLFLIDRLTYQGEGSLQRKMMRWLLMMAKYYGHTDEDGGCFIDLPLTQEVIAAFLHVTRESISKAMAPFVRHKIIQIERKRIRILNVDILKELLEHREFEPLNA